MAFNIGGLAGVYGGYTDAGLKTQQLNSAEVEAAGRAAFGRALMMSQQGTGGTPQALAPYATPIGPPPGSLPIPTGGGGPGAAGGPPPGSPAAPPPGMPPVGRAPMGPPSVGGAAPGSPPVNSGGPGPSPGPGGGAYPPPNVSRETPDQSAGNQGLDLGLRSIIQTIVKANPGATPQVIAAAVNQAIPLMNANAQQQWRQMQQQLGLQRLETQQDIAQLRTDTQRDIATQRGQTQEDIAGQRNQTQRDIAGQRSQTQEDIATGRNEQREADRVSRETIARERVSAQRVALDKFLQEHPNASALDIADFMKNFQRQSQTAATAAVKQQQAQNAANSVIKQINSAIGDIDSDTPVTGITGKGQRYLEWAGGLVGSDQGTKASDFQTKIRLIQSQLPRVIASTARLSADERAHLEEVVRGLGSFTNKQQAKSALEYVKTVILDRQGAPPEAGNQQLQGGATSGARPVPTERYSRPGVTPTSNQEPKTLPPSIISQMKPGHDYTMSDGTVWKLDDSGKPMQVLNAQ